MTIDELLKKDIPYFGKTKGVSMLPMLKEGRNSVLVERKKARLKRYDIALYFRDGEYVLHRVIRVLNDGYLIRGDNCYNDEYIKEEDVLGVLTSYYEGSKKKSINNIFYRTYCIIIRVAYPVRKIFVSIKGKLKNGDKNER